MKNITVFLVLVWGFSSLTVAQTTESAKKVNESMPNRISMNVTVPKQTQGATFGEKISASFIDGSCVLVFPNKQAFRITKSGGKIAQLSSTETSKINSGLHAAGSALSQGASLLGGALPGGQIISAAVSKADGSSPTTEIKVTDNSFQLPSTLTDGEYYLKIVSEPEANLKIQSKFGILVEGRSYKVISAN